MLKAVGTLVLILATSPAALAQSTSIEETERKQARAVRVDNGAIHVDGNLDELAWERAPQVSDFVQKEPIEGAVPSEPMEVRFVYDDGALFVGARMHKRVGSQIQAPMGRRDRSDQSEYILIALDTFLDRRTAYVFGVTASGVRVDRYHSLDDEDSFDDAYDPVWEAQTRADDEGWTAELWIPFSQLRFTGQESMVWGLNVHRHTPTFNEDDYWAPIPRTVKAWSSRFGMLGGIEGLTSSRRIEVVPYVAGASTVTGDRDRSNPFDDGRNLEGRVGADLKVGLGPNLTLDATINPDFGQVEADPAEVNLTAFETTFTEKRPFFIEGVNLLGLQGSNNNFFYSRRVGSSPVGQASGDFVDYPAVSTILGAAKITGRLPSGTSIGALTAVTAREEARTFNLAARTTNHVLVAPRTIYAVARVQQEFGANNSTASGMANFVYRDLPDGDPLASRLVRNAFAVAGDSVQRFKDGEYELVSYGGFTFLYGDPAAVATVQRSSAHYAQRPDRTYDRFDPTRTSLSGFKGNTMLSRVSGRHWIWNASTGYESPMFESNDIGRLNTADSITASTDLRFRETVPGKLFRSYWYGALVNQEWSHEWDAEVSNAQLYTRNVFRNFWVARTTLTHDFRRQTGRLTRGGPTMEIPGSWNLNLHLENSQSARTTWRADTTLARDEDGGLTNSVSVEVGIRPGPRWELSVEPSFEHDINTQQFITAIDGGRAETFGKRYAFGTTNRYTHSMQFRLTYTFRPDLTLDLYAEPFAASGRYSGIGELLRPRTRALRVYGQDGTTATRQPDGGLLVTDGASTFEVANRDFKVLSFRSNVVVKWEYRPGSLLYLVWQQDRRREETIDDRVGPGDPFRSLSVPGNNAFVVKSSFWMPFK